jgi:nitroreductase
MSDLRDVMRASGACRLFRPDPVDDDLLHRIFDVVRFGPSGGNRQPVRYVVVRDQAVKARMRELYLTAWEPYVAGLGVGSITTTNSSRVIVAADHFARHLDEIPAHVVVCARLADLHVTDAKLDRLSIVGGASVYPSVQNLLLACRDLGLGSALTTLLVEFEPELKELLAIPPEFAIACTVAIGHPDQKLPTKLKRLPVEEIVSIDRFGDALPVPSTVT